MPRTNPTAVQLLLAADFTPGASLTTAIETASMFIDNMVTRAAVKGYSLSSGQLEILERWVAAHCYCMSDKAFTSKSTAGASASYQGQTGMYFEATYYGQTAMRLDPTGCLDNMGGKERKVAGGIWLGKPPSAQIDYTDRS